MYVLVCQHVNTYVVSLASFFSPFEIQLYLLSASHIEPIHLHSDQNIYFWKGRIISSQKLSHSDLAFYFYFSDSLTNQIFLTWCTKTSIYYRKNKKYISIIIWRDQRSKTNKIGTLCSFLPRWWKENKIFYA